MQLIKLTTQNPYTLNVSGLSKDTFLTASCLVSSFLSAAVDVVDLRKPLAMRRW